jgi:cytochrome c
MSVLRFPAAVLASVLILGACGGPSGEGASSEAPAAAAAPLAEPKLTLADLPAPYNEANLDNGAMEFAKCRACHSVKPADGHLVGPNLHGVFDRAPGAAADYRYSPALTAFGTERTLWAPADLDHWLEKPTEFVPGSSMFFNGMNDATARRDLVGWLMVEASR